MYAPSSVSAVVVTNNSANILFNDLNSPAVNDYEIMHGPTGFFNPQNHVLM